jgi:WD40 repeat protein
LLAAEAYRLEPRVDTFAALLAGFTAAPAFLGSLQVGADGLVGGELAPDGRTLVTVDTTGRPRTVDVESGAEGPPFPAPEPGWTSLTSAVSGDGGTLAVSRTRTINDPTAPSVIDVYDVVSRRPRFTAVSVPFSAWDLAVNADGTRVAASGGAGDQFAVYDARSGQLVQTVGWLPHHLNRNEVGSAPLTFARDGRLFVGSPAGAVRIFDAELVEQEPIEAEAGASSRSLALESSDQVLVGSGWSSDRAGSAGGADTARWNVASGEEVWRRERASCEVAVAASRGLVLCGDDDGGIAVHVLSTGEPTGERFDVQHGSIDGIAVSGDDATLVVVGRGTGAVSRWGLDGRGLAVDQVAPGTVLPTYLPDSGLLVAEQSVSATPQLIDPDSGETPRELTGLDFYRTVMPGRVIGDLPSGRLGYYDLERDEYGALTTPTSPEIAGPGGAVFRVGTTDDLAVIFEDLSVAVYDPQGRSRQLDLPIGPGFFWMSFSPAGDLVALGRNSGIVVYDARSGEIVGERSDVRTVEIGPTGVAVGGTFDGRLVFFPIDEPEATIGEMNAGPGFIEQVAFSADGTRLLTYSPGGSIRLIDVETRTEIGVIPTTPSTWLTSLRPDGNAIAFDGDHHAISIWDLDPDRLAEAACRLAGRTLTADERDIYLAGFENGGESAC